MSPSYTQVNFNLGLEIDENSRVQLSVSNLTDERSEAFRFLLNHQAIVLEIIFNGYRLERSDCLIQETAQSVVCT